MIEKIKYPSRENLKEEQGENTIETMDPKEKINLRILGYQFDYFDRIRKNKIKPIEDNYEEDKDKKLGSLLFKHTDIGGYIRDEYQKRIINEKQNKEYFSKIHDLVLELIDKINNTYGHGEEYEKEEWKEGINTLIKSELEKIGPVIERETSGSQENRKLGLAGYWVNKINDSGKIIMDIHLDPLINLSSSNESIRNIFSGETLKNIAISIIDKYPEVGEIKADSWIVDSAIGKRIGFTQTKRVFKTNGMSFWGQFVDQNGLIKEEEIKKFISTGIPKYYRTEGSIRTEDFLKKHLPQNRKGLIKLRELTPVSQAFNEFLAEVDNRLASVSYENIDDLLMSNPTMSYYIKTREGQKFLAMVIKYQKEFSTKEEIKLTEEEKTVLDNFKKFKEEMLHIFNEREVFID